MRICILLCKAKHPDTATQALNGEIPRPEYLVLQEALRATVFDFSDVEASTNPLVVAARQRGTRFGLATLGFLHRNDFDQFYCTGEDIAFPFAMLMSSVGDLGRITSVVHNTHTPRRHAILRTLPSAVWRNIICLGDEQYRVVTDENHVPRGRVVKFPYWVDTVFYDPKKVTPKVEPSYVFACGQESRDYPTLQDAAARMDDVPFRVVASGWSPSAGFQTTGGINETKNVSVEGGGLSYMDLRARYDGARVVAVPVKNVTYGAGTTSVVEAMCMAKPAVANASPGIVDYIDDGVSGVIVPIGDGAAMARALDRFMKDPAMAVDMGARNREYAETHFAMSRYVHRVAGLYGLVPKPGPFQAPDDLLHYEP
jgi:glycosyltransferase involved in cell wall biosynthesis